EIIRKPSLRAGASAVPVASEGCVIIPRHEKEWRRRGSFSAVASNDKIFGGAVVIADHQQMQMKIHRVGEVEMRGHAGGGIEELAVLGVICETIHFIERVPIRLLFRVGLVLFVAPMAVLIEDGGMIDALVNAGVLGVV